MVTGQPEKIAFGNSGSLTIIKEEQKTEKEEE